MFPLKRLVRITYVKFVQPTFIICASNDRLTPSMSRWYREDSIQTNSSFDTYIRFLFGLFVFHLDIEIELSTLLLAEPCFYQKQGSLSIVILPNFPLLLLGICDVSQEVFFPKFLYTESAIPSTPSNLA